MKALLVSLGAVVGAVIGYMASSSVMFFGMTAGRLPVGVVLTGGATLGGFDSLLVEQARSAQFTTLLAAAIGGLVGFVIAWAMRSKAPTTN